MLTLLSQILIRQTRTFSIPDYGKPLVIHLKNQPITEASELKAVKEQEESGKSTNMKKVFPIRFEPRITGWDKQ